ncbi:MAG: metallophosphoesterase [Promethearchaeota archaeon]
MNSLDNQQIRSKRSILINPNLGHPLILNIKPKLKQRSFQARVLFASNIEDLKNFRTSIKNNIHLLPIIEYKWKLKSILKKKEKEKKKKWHGIKQRILKFIRREKKIERDVNKHKGISKLKPRPIRGDPIIPVVYDVESTSIIPINEPMYLENEYISPQNYLIKHDAFEGLSFFYKATLDFELTKEVIEFLKIRNFVMFDIHQGKKRINYHAIVISKNNWDNFNVIHATDLHLAARNDRLYEIIKNWSRKIKKQELEKKIKKFRKNKNFLKKERPALKKPLIKRLINPNNQFRKFIKIMNKKIYQNELDFIVLTGDLIDFTLISKSNKTNIKTANFQYENTNWQVFKDIITNYPLKNNPKFRAISKNEELLCPIFTTLGNHDFRIAGYDLNWGGMYKKMGLNAFEALSLNEILSASPIDAITKSYNALKGYWSEINPSLDFSIKLGRNIFIFLNSGADSFKNIRDLLAGHPSVTGLSSRQINYLENIINNQYDPEHNIFLFVHGPPINTGQKRSIVKRLGKMLGKKDIFVKISDFKESFIKKLEKNPLKARIDGKFNVKYGTISTNWEKLIKFCKDYCVLVLSGHTHKLKEFKLKDPEGKTTKVFDAPPFILKKIENPAAIFHDIYSELYTNSDEIKNNGPFVVQTPALGLGSLKDLKTAGAYREIYVKDGNLESFKVNYLDRKI